MQDKAVSSENAPPHLNLLDKSNLNIRQNRRKTLVFMPVETNARGLRQSLPLLDVTNAPLPSSTEPTMKSCLQVEKIPGPATHYIGKKRTRVRRRVPAPEPIVHPVPHAILKDIPNTPLPPPPPGGYPLTVKRVRFKSSTLSTAGDTLMPDEALNPQSELSSDTLSLVVSDVPPSSVSPVSFIAPIAHIAPVASVSSVSPVDPVASISLVAPIDPISAISPPPGRYQAKFPVLRKAVSYALPLAKFTLLIVVSIVTWKQLKWSFYYGPNAHSYSTLFEVIR